MDNGALQGGHREKGLTLMELLDGPFGVQLELEPDTRVFNITGRASAAMLLFLLMDASPGSLIAKL